MKLSTAALLVSIGSASAFFGQAPLPSVRQSSHSMVFSQSILDAVNGPVTSTARMSTTRNNMESRDSALEKGRGPATIIRENTQGTMNEVTGRGPAMNQLNGRRYTMNQRYGRRSTMDQGYGRGATMNQGYGRGSTMNQGYGSTMNQRYGSTMNQRYSSNVNRRYDSTMNQGYGSTMYQGYGSRDSAITRVNGRNSAMTRSNGPYANDAERIMMDSEEVLVQGGSLRTWSYPSPMVENVQVVLATGGRPMDADVQLWQGPDNTPIKMRVYTEDGESRPFSAIIDTPRGPNTISVRNIGAIEFPLASYVAPNVADGAYNIQVDPMSMPMTIQGGALRTFPFDPSVESVAVMLKTDGRPLNARIELLQGPNNNKQVVELYTEDGMDRPFFCVIASPGSGNVVRIVNTSPVEFPMYAWVEANEIDYNYSAMNPVYGGDSGFFGNRNGNSRFY